MPDDQITHRKRLRPTRTSRKVGFRPGLPKDVGGKAAKPVKKKHSEPPHTQSVVVTNLPESNGPVLKPPVDEQPITEMGSASAAAEPEGNRTVTPEEAQKQCEDYAAHLLTVEKKDRDKAMRTLKKDNPTGHAVVKDIMAKRRQEAKAAAKAEKDASKGK